MPINRGFKVESPLFGSVTNIQKPKPFIFANTVIMLKLMYATPIALLACLESQEVKKNN